MRLAIISDIHDNLANLKKCLDWCRKNNIKEIICCGDVTNVDTLKFLSSKFSGIIRLVSGNIEIFNDEDVGRFSNIKYYGRIGRFELAKRTIGFCHEPFLIKKVLEQGLCDIIFYGHTHKPWLETKDNVQLINPGTLGGVFQKASFAMWDIKKNKIDLKIL